MNIFVLMSAVCLAFGFAAIVADMRWFRDQEVRIVRDVWQDAGPACPQCGMPSDDCILPVDNGPVVVSILCASCHGSAYRSFVWIKTWSMRLERAGIPIGWWWAFWTWMPLRLTPGSRP